jgi:hypothetical protein
MVHTMAKMKNLKDFEKGPMFTPGEAALTVEQRVDEAVLRVLRQTFV